MVVWVSPATNTIHRIRGPSLTGTLSTATEPMPHSEIGSPFPLTTGCGVGSPGEAPCRQQARSPSQPGGFWWECNVQRWKHRPKPLRVGVWFSAVRLSYSSREHTGFSWRDPTAWKGGRFADLSVISPGCRISTFTPAKTWPNGIVKERKISTLLEKCFSFALKYKSQWTSSLIYKYIYI